jgi:hypothetical protein
MDRVRVKLLAVDAFTPRGGIQKKRPNGNATQPEPTDDPPHSAQQQGFAPPATQGSGHHPSQYWAPPLSQQSPILPHQFNNFSATPNYINAAQHYYGTQPSPLPQRGWTDSTQPYPPHQAQPPQTPTNNNAHDGFPHSYAHSTSSFDQYSQYASSINSNGPPQTSSVPPYSNEGPYSPPQSQEPYSPHPLFQRSHTEPQPGPSYAPHFSGQPWSQPQVPDHDCNQYRYSYVQGYLCSVLNN